MNTFKYLLNVFDNVFIFKIAVKGKERDQNVTLSSTSTIYLISWLTNVPTPGLQGQFKPHPVRKEAQGAGPAGETFLCTDM